jgi:3-deoxy-D-manno-octulosonic acid kinase
MEDLRLNPTLSAASRETLARRGLSRLWEEAEPLPGGRGSARLLRLEGVPFVVKRERRGGRLSALFPDRYLSKGPFLKEWALGLHLSERGLAPEPAALLLQGCPLGFRAVAMTSALLPSRSLAELWREGALGGGTLGRVGEAVSALHRAGVIHGDLNAGNLLFTEAPLPLLIDLRHSRWTQEPPAPAARRHNLLRLCRSLHKLQRLHGLAWPEDPWKALLAGYTRGWGGEEPWHPAFLSAAARGFPVRSLFW